MNALLRPERLMPDLLLSAAARNPDGAALITHRSPARWLRPRDTPERLAFAE